MTIDSSGTSMLHDPAAAAQLARRRDRRRDEILVAAERILSREGPRATTVRRIAAAIGVSSAALYGYFPDKDAILVAICERTARGLLRLNQGVAEGSAPAIARLRQILANCVEWGLDHPHVYRLLFAPDSDAAPILLEAGRALLRESFQQVAAVAREAERDGVLAPETADAATEACWATCHGLTMMLIARARASTRLPAKALADFTLDHLLAGLGGPQMATRRPGS